MHETAMCIAITNSMRRTSYLVGLAALLLANSAAIAAEETSSGSTACAEREALLMTLVEAHGSAPNFATDLLATKGVALIQMRTACENGHAKDAAAFYDQLIADLTASLAQPNK